MRHLLSLFSVCIMFLISSCGSNNTEATENDGETETSSVEAIDTCFHLDNIQNAELSEEDDFPTIFHELSLHRYVGFPYFKQENAECWAVCNEIYGAYLFSKSIGQEDIIDTLMDWRLNKYLEAKGLRLKLGGGKEYAQMEQFVKRFRTNDSRDLELDEDAQDNRLEILFDVYTSYYFQKKLSDMPENKQLAKAMEAERLSWKVVKRAQKNLLKALYEGNAPTTDMIGLSKAQSKEKTKSDIDLYSLLTQKNYATSDTLYEKLTEQFAFYDVYNVFIKDIKATGKVGFGKKIQALTDEQKAWMGYIYARRVLSGKLSKEQEAIYDNATNRMQKWHIIQLKNRFKGYGYCSEAFKNSLLQENCSYTDFYKYVPMKLDAQF